MLEPKKPDEPVDGGLKSDTTQQTEKGGQKGGTDSTDTKQQK